MNPIRDVLSARLSAFAVMAALGLPLLLHGPESHDRNAAPIPFSGRCVGLHPATTGIGPDLQVLVVICVDQGRTDAERGSARWSGSGKPISIGALP